jgi:hypothetical protein
MDDHQHGADGHVVITEPSPAEAELEAAAVVTDASVEIARIEADRDVTLAKISARTYQPDIEAELAAAREEIETLRRQLEPPAPVADDQAPVVIVDDSASEDQAEPTESLPEPDEHSEPAERRRKPLGLGVW